MVRMFIPVQQQPKSKSFESRSQLPLGIPGILEQELGLSKSIFPYLPRDEEKMLPEENIVPGTTLTVVAAAWHVTRAMWQQFTVQWLGPSNSIKIEHFRRPVMIVQIVPHATYVFVFWDGGAKHMLCSNACSEFRSICRGPFMSVYCVWIMKANMVHKVADP